MSRIATVNCPLSDCTLVVDNAENIRNSNDKVLLGLKAEIAAAAAAVVAPSLRKQHVRSAKQPAVAADRLEKAPSMRREGVVGAARKVNARTVVTTAPASLEAHRPSALDMHVFAKPFTPAVSTPRRNDPYSLCLLQSPCTPEDGFYACYCDAAAVAEAEPVSPLRTPVRSLNTGKTTLGETTRNLLEMFSLASTPSKSPCGVTPSRSTEATPQSPAATPERATTTSAAPAATSTRVVRKVVSCNVDRTSGRPVPKPRAAA